MPTCTGIQYQAQHIRLILALNICHLSYAVAIMQPRNDARQKQEDQSNMQRYAEFLNQM